MARELTTGKAQSVMPEDFNERVKRLLADKLAWSDRFLDRAR